MDFDRILGRGTAIAVLAALCVAGPTALGSSPAVAASHGGHGGAAHSEAGATCGIERRSTIAVGSPGATEGDDQDAGAVTVAIGSQDGLVGQQLITPASPGIPDTPQVEGGFGRQVAIGNFNGDNCPDLAIMQDEPSGDAQVVVLFGVPGGGFTTTGAQTFGQNQVCDMSCGDPESLPHLGAVMVAGNFEGNGYDDLALSVTSSDGYGNQVIVVVPGGPDGLQPSASDPVFSGTPADASLSSLSIGDVNGDGLDDLVAGFGAYRVPPDELARPTHPDKVGDAYDAGDVTVIYGARTGIGTGMPQQSVNRATPGVPGKEMYASARHPYLPMEVSAGIANPGRYADVAFSEARSSTVTVLQGSKSGLITKHAQTLSKSTPGVPGKPKSDDQWGASLAFGRYGDNDEEDLAVGDPTTQHVTILPGAKHGLVGKKACEQFSPSTAGVPGKLVKGEDWSSTLAVGNFGHGRNDDLAVADPEADHDRGSITVLYADYHDPIGLRAKHSQRLTRSTPGFPGPADTLDFFGSSESAGGW
jgi:hypothetical protein